MNESTDKRSSVLDFFAGSGLASEGLKPFYRTIWANDICPKKAAVFRANFGQDIFELGPIQEVRGTDVPIADLSWGSFPCQDLSLAGNMGGIGSARSGLVWHWIRVMDEMKVRPPIAVAENVGGLISSAKGNNYKTLHYTLVDRGYKVGAVVLDAAYWVPQSRKRVFVIAVKRSVDTSQFEEDGPSWCHPAAICNVAGALPDWIWWKISEPAPRKQTLSDLIEADAEVFDQKRTERLLSLIPEAHRLRMDSSEFKGGAIFPAYKRIRKGTQVLELRFDGVAGCLRTPEGGSSRQFLVIKNNGSTRARLLTVREAAALMGARKTYKIPGSYNDGYRAMGDAVVVPVVRHLAKSLLSPLSNEVEACRKRR